MMLDKNILLELHKPVPRYTSFPPATEFREITSATYKNALVKSYNKDLSLYIHIPFCSSMCLYCACSVILNRKEEKQQKYVDSLLQEIDLVASLLKNNKIRQLHFGGGTPTLLSKEQFHQIFSKLFSVFSFSGDAEISLEVDPRTIDDKSYLFYKTLGFNRVSMGLQDTNEKVQEAVKRRQSHAESKKAVLLAKQAGFESINVDLIYGLPFQTVKSFDKTTKDILQMDPDRIAMFSYAKVPWLKPHQKAIKENTLPSMEEKFEIYVNASKTFLENGYVAIGMDHFAKANDTLAKGLADKSLHRSFQGYTTSKCVDLVGLGVTSIGFVNGAYFQNVKELPAYYKSIEEKTLPVLRGVILTEQDHIVDYVIKSLMCRFEVDKKAFYEKFDHQFDRFFSLALDELEIMVKQGLIILDKDMIKATKLGSLFIRNIASVFDPYYKKPKEQKFSYSV